MKRGVLVASDQKQEWLLPWWWASYSLFNTYPVTFVDWGLSREAKKWCLERGQLVSPSVAPEFLDPNVELAPKIRRAINDRDLPFLLKTRPYWFSKPLVMRDYAYESTLWIDLDCEVLASLSGIFAYMECPAGLAIARDTERSQICNQELGVLREGTLLYNSGVVVYRKDSPLINAWAELCFTNHVNFLGDQDVFSYLVHVSKYEFCELPPIYNWRISQGLHFSAQIVHWAGSWGKAFIRKHGGLRQFAKQCGFDLNF